jgi:dephospho-CoA kinase
MKIIGLTGGIGSGKSTVSRFLAEFGAVLIDADKVGHKAFEPDTEVWREVVSAFGRQILTPKGDIDRIKLGKLVFGNSESLARLNQIMHPRMLDMVEAQIEEYRQQGVDVLVIEAPLLLEANWVPSVDEVWVVIATEATVLKRLQERTGLSESESLDRIRSQISNEERVKHASVIINNDNSLTDLRFKVKDIWQRLNTRGTDRY